MDAEDDRPEDHFEEGAASDEAGRDAGGNAGAIGDPDADADSEAGDSGRLRRTLAAMAPQGPLQVTIAVLALLFFAGSLGYLIGTRHQHPTSAVDDGFLV